ncbi:MAG: ATP-dependent helicase HrpB [Gemmatimonadetes bacterium]|nr:ATP-dependent helicase HrpB [Gemmatimonadota bacterium]
MVPVETRLPIELVLDDLRAALAAGASVVLQAPPGAGKTTRVPLALLEAAWLGGRNIVMLEPRRVAARAAARYMARSLGEEAGGSVGYRTRLDTRVGPRTRIEVVTEGILTRMIRADPALEGYGLVVFDEFHERSLHADLGLALALETQSILRPELRLLVMSATLDGQRVSRLLGDAPVVTSVGRSYPVEMRYASGPAEGRMEGRVARAVGDVLARDAGDVLVFLPGAGEIRRVEEMLTGGEAVIVPLHGNLTPEQQDRALRPDERGRRKVILATSIAETSLTIDGVRVVVDCGLSRVPRFSARTGMTRLETVRVSRASADQRAGRAGRQAPGVCQRLWSEPEQAGLVPFHDPEIMDADLAPLALTLAVAGMEASALRWLDPPPAAHLSQARQLLQDLDAVDGEGRITPHGRELAALGLHPRLGHMIIASRALKATPLATDIAALVEERDILRAEGGPADPDMRIRLDLLAQRNTPPFAHGARVAREAVERIRTHARVLRRQLGVHDAASNSGDAGLLLALAFPDRIAQRRAGTARFLLRNGRGAVLAVPHALADAEFIVATDLDDRGAESRIFLAAPVTREEIEEHLASQIVVQVEVAWSADAARVEARRTRRLGAIVLGEGTVRDPDPAAVAHAFKTGLGRAGLAAIPWSEGFRRLRERLAFLHQNDGASWPDVSDAVLLDRLEGWLAPHASRLRGLADLGKIDFTALQLADLSWQQRQALDVDAPTHLEVPSGSRLPIDYGDPESPVLAVRLQEMFGLAETPRIARGRVPLTLHLLSPAHRPVQVTRDLAGFWRSSYHDVRKDLRGRYPKHVWPEDPLTEAPTRRAKPGKR